MRKLRRAAIGALRCGVVLCLATPVHAEPTETLGDAIALAYQTNPTLQAARAQQRATDEGYVQARAGFRPTLTGTFGITRDQNQGNLQLFGTPPQLTNTASGSVVVEQPIYSGGRVATAVDAAKADVLAGRQGLRETEIQVLDAVIQAYVNVRRDQEQLAIAEDNVSVLKRQLEETNARFDVGEVTRTDVAQAQARLAQAQAQLSTVQANLAIDRASYASLVGQNPGTLAPEPPISALLPADIDAAFDAAERSNPQLMQADYTERASAARVAQAKAQLNPTIGFRAGLTYNGGNTNFSVGGPEPNPLKGFQRDINVSATATVPLFTGGLTLSEIRQATERNNVDRINLEAARRQVLQAVSQAWNQLLGARAELVANEAQVKADIVAYEGVREEQQVGLRTTLDILNAQQELENAELALVGARHDEYVASAAVLAAMGALQAETLAPDAPRYDPAANFKKVVHAPGWTPWEPAIEAIDRVGQPPAPAPPPGEVLKTAH